MHLVLTRNWSFLGCVDITNEICLRKLYEVIILKLMCFSFLWPNLVEEVVKFVWKVLGYLIIVQTSFFLLGFAHSTKASLHAAESAYREKDKNTSTYLYVNWMIWLDWQWISKFN